MAQSHPGLDPWAVQLRVGERDARYAVGAVLGPAPGQLLTWAAGVLPSTDQDGVVVDLLVIDDEPKPSMHLRIYPGQCVISRPGQGPYVCTLDATGIVTLDDADPSHGRIDLVVARVYDERIGDSQTGFVIEPVTGTAAAEPVAPEVPAGAVGLARVPVPAATTQIPGGTISDIRRAAHIRTGIGVVLSGDDPGQAGAYPGHTRFRNAGLESWDGQRWRGAHRMDVYDTSEIAVLSGMTGIAPLASVNVADPGWPYRLLVSGSAELVATGCHADLNVRLDTPDGPVLAVGVGPTNGSKPITTATRPSGVLGGTHTVFLSGVRIDGDGTWANTPYSANLTALVVPA
jgi:hypothetical protein